MGSGKLHSPDADKAIALARVAIHARALLVVHVVAILGTGLAALAMAPAFPLYRISKGQFLFTLSKVLWVGWPYLTSLGVSRSRLPGKTRATGLFMVLLIVVTAVGGILLDTPLATGNWGWDVFEIAAGETLVLTVAAEMLSTAEWAGR